MAAGSPGTFELAARQGLGVLCFAFGPPEGFIPLIEKYKKDIKNAEPIGDYVNDNVMITTQMLCLEDGGKAREAAAQMDSGYYISLVFRYLDTFPRPPGIPEWPQTIPDQTPEQINKSIESRSIAIGDPDEVTRDHQALRGDGGRPAELRDAVVGHAHRDVRRGGGHLRQARPARSSTRTPCTAPPGSEKPRSG